MSDDYSSFDRDYVQRPKRKHDLKPNKFSPKEYTVYEPKPKNKYSKNKGDGHDSSPRYDEDYNSYKNHGSRDNRYDNYITYTPKAPSKGNKGEANKSMIWKKENVKTNTNSFRSQEAARSDKYVDQYVAKQRKTYMEEQQFSAKNSNAKDQTQEYRSTTGEDFSTSSSRNSTDTTNSDRRQSTELTDFIQDKLESAQSESKSLVTLSYKEITGNQTAEQETSLTVNILQEIKKDDEVKNMTNDSAKMKEILQEKEKDVAQEKSGEVSPEAGESDEDHYSNIDLMVEKKFEQKVYVDELNKSEDELRGDLEELEDNQRPEWEELDSLKVLEDIKKKDYLSLIPQDIKLTWKPRQLDLFDKENEQNKQDRHTSIQDEEDFDKIFAVKAFGVNFFSSPLATGSNSLASFNSIKSNNLKLDTKALNPKQPLLTENFEQGFPFKNTNTPLPAFQSNRIESSKNCLSVTKKASQTQSDGSNQEIPQSHKPTNIAENITFPIFRHLSPDYDVKIWSYLDLQGVLQGPYSGRMMDEWYLKGYLPSDLKVTIGINNGFRTLKDLGEIIARTPTPLLTSYNDKNKFDDRNTKLDNRLNNNLNPLQDASSYSQRMATPSLGEKQMLKETSPAIPWWTTPQLRQDDILAYQTSLNENIHSGYNYVRDFQALPKIPLKTSSNQSTDNKNAELQKLLDGSQIISQEKPQSKRLAAFNIFNDSKYAENQNDEEYQKEKNLSPENSMNNSLYPQSNFVNQQSRFKTFCSENSSPNQRNNDYFWNNLVVNNTGNTVVTSNPLQSSPRIPMNIQLQNAQYAAPNNLMISNHTLNRTYSTQQQPKNCFSLNKGPLVWNYFNPGDTNNVELKQNQTTTLFR